MDALVVAEGGPFLVDRPVPRPGPGEALLRVRLAGICSTDHQILAGYTQHRGVLGHEMVATALACAAPEAGAWVGQRVVGEINLACGGCEMCRAGLGRHCQRRRVMGIRDRDGCFAAHVCLPLANLHRVPDRVPDEAAVFTEPLAAAFAVLEHVVPGDRVVVLGDGKLGLLVALALASEGRSPLLVGRHADKLALAAAAGVATRLGADGDGVGVGLADVVIEATGSPAGLAQALTWVRPRGRVILKSTCAAPSPVDLSRVVVDEIQLVGSRCGPFDRALAALDSGAVDPRPLITARYPLSQAGAALEHARRPGVLKVLLEPAVADRAAAAP